MSLLTRSRDLTTRLVGQFGETATLIRPGVPDHTTKPPTIGEETGFAFKVVPTRPGFMDTMAGNTETGDMPLILAVGETEPTTNDKIKVDGHRYSIKSVKQIKAQGGVAAWKVIARGGVPDKAG